MRWFILYSKWVGYLFVICFTRAAAQRDMANISLLPADNPLLTSSHSLSLMGPGVSIKNEIEHVLCHSSFFMKLVSFILL